MGITSWSARLPRPDNLIKSTLQLIDAGFVDRLFLSNDAVLGAALLPAEGQGDREKNNPDGILFNSRRLRTRVAPLASIGLG